MRILSPKIFLLVTSIFLFVMPSLGQNEGPPDNTRPERRQMGGEDRPDLISELGLTAEQRQSIRQMNQARKPLMQELTARLREANQTLDMAIYADRLNEEEVTARLRDFQAAQAEVAKLRFRAELELRKVLTPEQLGKFRTLRERFARQREMRQDMRRTASPRQRPLKRIRQLPKRGNPI